MTSTNNTSTDEIPSVQINYYCERIGSWTRARTVTRRRELLGAIDTYDRLGLNYKITRGGAEIELTEATR